MTGRDGIGPRAQAERGLGLGAALGSGRSAGAQAGPPFSRAMVAGVIA